MIRFLNILTCMVLVKTVVGHPTVYRYNEQNNLEPALVPVSSTVIPLMLYDTNNYGKNHNKRNVDEQDFPKENLITVKVREKGFE